MKTHLPTEQRIRNFTRELHKCAVTTYMDKNAGAGILMCKRHHYNITKATFYDDTDHYKHTHKNKSEIMEDFQKFHEKNGEKIHRFHGEKRSIPYAYTLLKFKDINWKLKLSALGKVIPDINKRKKLLVKGSHFNTLLKLLRQTDWAKTPVFFQFQRNGRWKHED